MIRSIFKNIWYNFNVCLIPTNLSVEIFKFSLILIKYSQHLELISSYTVVDTKFGLTAKNEH